MKKVFIAGGASFDSIIYLPSFPGNQPKTIHKCKFSEGIGSTGAGKALNLCKLDFNVNLHAIIGDDSWGKTITTELIQPNLSFSFEIDIAGTERHTNLMNEKGERISIFTNTLTDNPEMDYQKFTSFINEADFIVVNLASYTKPILAMAKNAGKKIWTDLHDYDGINPWYKEYIEYSDYILLSSDNLPDYKALMKKMINEGKELVVVTHGKKGSTGLSKNGEWIEVPALTKFDLVDSNGAGDAYFSGFMFGFANNYNLKKCMELGSIAGALCINSSNLSNAKISSEYLLKLHSDYFR